MVCKELDELCAKFGSLSPHLRIDYIYGMLRMCLPPELRFIGSVVEDLAKKDFNFLREHENRANSQIELQKYSKVNEKTLIEGMAFNLSLLHSVNTACANIIFSLLEENLKCAFLISSTTDKKTIDIILLVLTMAKYHPAFTFHQRTTIAEYFKKVEQQLHDICAKSKTSDDRHSPNPLSTACYTCSVSTATKVHTPTTGNHNKGHIISVDVKQDKLQRRYDRKHEYRIQVSWENGEMTEISKTYQEVRDFHQKECHHCSDKEDVVRHDGTLFYLGSPQKDDGPDNAYHLVSSLIRHLFSLSKTVKDKEGYIQFFKGENSNSNIPLPPTTTPDSPMAYDKAEDLESMFTPHTQTPSFTMFNPGFPQGELVGCIPPVATGPYIGSPYRVPIYQSPQSSNHGSPVNSRSASPGDTGVDQVTYLLGKIQLMKYKNRLEKLSIEQLSDLSMDVLVKEYDVNADDAARIMAELEERTREKLPNRLPNGRHVEQCIPGPHYPALWQYMHPPPQPVYPHHVMPYQFPANVMVNKDSSSSENSSPSRSPVPQNKPQLKGADSSSDDSEKGNRVDSPHEDMRKKVRHPSHNREERDTPPQTVLHAFENVHGQGAGSGYQSDPTPGPFVRVIVANNSYITQPTHSNLNLPSKTVINMPENMGGRRIGLAFPYPRCDTQTTTVTSNSNNSGPDMNRRPMIPGQIPFIRSTINGNGRSFMCSVSNSTTPIMATNLQSNINGNIRTSSMPQVMSEPGLSPSQNTDIQNGVTTSSQQSNGNPVSCSSTNGHSSSSHSQCTSCGCTGGHSVPSYQFHVPNQYIQNQMFMPPFMSANPNGIVHHPFYHPVQYPISNGIPPSYLQAINHNHPFSNIPGAQYGCFPPVVLRRNSAGYSVSKQPRSTCSNCGSTEHISSECKENSMESMSASFHLKYDPKSNSD